MPVFTTGWGWVAIFSKRPGTFQLPKGGSFSGTFSRLIPIFNYPEAKDWREQNKHSTHVWLCA
jgi:hypothetical protein